MKKKLWLEIYLHDIKFYVYLFLRLIEKKKNLNHHLSSISNVSYSLDHVKSHLDAAMSVIAPRGRQTGNAVVTVAEKFYPEAMILGRESIEPREEIVQHPDEFLSAALTGQSFENKQTNK